MDCSNLLFGKRKKNLGEEGERPNLEQKRVNKRQKGSNQDLTSPRPLIEGPRGLQKKGRRRKAFTICATPARPNGKQSRKGP